VPTAQFTHFVHELASSTLQSLLGAAPPNPCPSAFTNLFHTNVYLVFFFSTFKVHLNILLPVSFTICPTSLNFNNNSLSYPQNNISSTSSTLIQFRSTYSYFYSTPISVATTQLEAGPASRTSRFCNLANRTDPGKSRGSNGCRQSIDLT